MYSFFIRLSQFGFECLKLFSENDMVVKKSVRRNQTSPDRYVNRNNNNRECVDNACDDVYDDGGGG